MSMEQSVEWLAGETVVLGENLPAQCRFAHHKSHMTLPRLVPGPLGGKPATNPTKHFIGRFTPLERTPGTQYRGDWVGPRVGLDGVVAHLCTDWAILARRKKERVAKWKKLKGENEDEISLLEFMFLSGHADST
jgi:hypothetical protein